jgi:hypothetical protein
LVIAAGAWSKELAAQVGHRVPLESHRGYHAMVADPAAAPRNAMDRAQVHRHADAARCAVCRTVETRHRAARLHRADILLAHGRRMLPRLAGGKVRGGWAIGPACRLGAGRPQPQCAKCTKRSGTPHRPDHRGQHRQARQHRHQAAARIDPTLSHRWFESSMTDTLDGFLRVHRDRRRRPWRAFARFRTASQPAIDRCRRRRHVAEAQQGWRSRRAVIWRMMHCCHRQADAVGVDHTSPPAASLAYILGHSRPRLVIADDDTSRQSGRRRGVRRGSW